MVHRYLKQIRDTSGNLKFYKFVFVFLEKSVRIEYCVISEPVPTAVGIAIKGNAGGFIYFTL